jgi:hypothetical protein
VRAAQQSRPAAPLPTSFTPPRSPGRAALLTDRQRGYARRAAAVRRKEQP